LDFSKIEAGKLEIINDYFDLWELLDGVKSLVALMMKQKGLKFTCNFANDLPHVVYSDGKRLRQILVNLLNNAYKYTAAGSVSLSVQKLASGDLAFVVTDTGIGIKADESHKLFMEFEQLDLVRNKHVTGTGLGLAITKRICDLMGGTIGVESVYGKGSTFSVELPLRFGQDSDLAQEDTAAPQFTARNARVLIVDDVEVNLEIARYMLEPFAVQTQVAMNGKQAIELIGREHFDLVLMDHMMPVMDGVEATRIIRQNELALEQSSGKPARHLAIISQTANAISGVEEMFANEGFDDFISKPVDAGDLARALFKHLPRELIDNS
jgi:CheY-like chemotaxis protein